MTEIVRSELERMLEDFRNNGGEITVCKPGKALKANSTFGRTRSGVAYVGERAASLKKEPAARRRKNKA